MIFIIFFLDFNFVNSFNNNFNINLIKYSSYVLPKIDVFGHKILELNRDLISKIAESDLDVATKKVLLLDIIKATQIGDSFGSFVLDNYYHLVDKLL